LPTEDDTKRKAHLMTYYNWIEARPGAFGSAVCDRPWDFELLEKTLVEKMSHILSLILGFFYTMDHHCFVFFPDTANPASGWKDFFAFYDLYRRLPKQTIDQFGPYYFVIQLPSA
jgi:hypothetical protein